MDLTRLLALKGVGRHTRPAFAVGYVEARDGMLLLWRRLETLQFAFVAAVRACQGDKKQMVLSTV